jgi:hypothetical protein
MDVRILSAGVGRSSGMFMFMFLFVFMFHLYKVKLERILVKTIC